MKLRGPRISKNVPLIVLSILSLLVVGLHFSSVSIAGSDISVGDADVIAFDHQNNRLITAVSEGGIINVYDPMKGTLINSYRHEGVGRFSAPKSMLYERNSNKLFIADDLEENGGQKILVYDGSNFSYLGSIANLNKQKLIGINTILYDEKLNHIIVEDRHGISFFNPTDLNYISSLEFHADADFNPMSDKSEMYSLGFNSKTRRLYFAKSLNNISITAPNLTGYRACIAEFDVDNGKFIRSFGCSSKGKVSQVDEVNLSVIQASTIDPVSGNLIISDTFYTNGAPDGKPHRANFRIQTFDTKNFKRLKVLDTNQNDELVDLKSLDAFSNVVYVLCASRPPYADGQVKIFH